LRALDGAGQPPGAGSATAWRARESFAPADLELRVHGMFTGGAAGERFEECLTGRAYTVAPGGDQATLAREYAALAAAAPGTPVLASFDGILRQAPAGSAAPDVIVQRFTGLWPGQTCERAMSHASLSHQYWRVERLHGQRLEPAHEAGDMYVILRGEAGGYVANAGCGRFAGTYRVDGPAISIAAAATRPQCPAQLAGRQQQLQAVLAAAAGWAIQGQVLELFDAAGRSLAALEAVYFN
jgi:heat shock protein HslJ